MNLLESINSLNRIRTKRVIISDQRYFDWVRLACWDRLKSQTLGQSFCNYFDIKDDFLLYTKDQKHHWEHIQRHYRTRCSLVSKSKSANQWIGLTDGKPT